MTFSPDSQRNILPLARCAAKGSVHSAAFKELEKTLCRRARNWVAQQRALLRMTQEQFAHLVGKTRNTVANWESANGTRISKADADAIELLVRVTLDELGPVERKLKSGIYPAVTQNDQEKTG